MNSETGLAAPSPLAVPRCADIFGVSERVVVGALVSLCLALRLLAASQLSVISYDGSYFLHTAAALEQGDFITAFYYTGPNIYQPCLTAVKQVVGDYETSAKLWGVLVSVLTLPPLFGLMRRLFDDRTATITCFLYAVHPSFVKWAAEPIRDPTFWLLLTLTLYTLQRSTETRPLSWLFAAGVTTTLAMYLRKEGWLLWLPLVGTALLPPHMKLSRATALRRFVLAAAMPAVVVSFAAYYEWDRRRSADDPHSLADTTRFQVNVSPQSLISSYKGEFGPTAVRYVEQLIKAASPVVGVLCAVGLWRRRQLLFTPEHRYVTAMNLSLMAAVAWYLLKHADMNTRYFLPAVLCSLPYAAMEVARLVELVSRCRSPAFAPTFIAAGVAVLLALGIAGACKPPEPERVEMAALGRYLHRTFGDDLVLANFGNASIVIHYAAPKSLLGLNYPPDKIGREQFALVRPDAVVIQGLPDAVEACARFCSRHGYRPTNLRGIVSDPSELTVYVRSDEAQTAELRPIGIRR